MFGYLRRAAWIAGAFVLLLLVAAAAAKGAFGAHAQDVMLSIVGPLWAILQANERPLELAGKAMAMLAALVSVTWGIYKSWYYAEINLPMRIEDFLRRNDERLIVGLPRFVEALDGERSRVAIRPPIAFVGPLNRAFREIGLGWDKRAPETLQSSIDAMKLQLNMSQHYLAQCRAQLAAAHVMTAASLSAKATMAEKNEARRLDLEALKQLDAAIELDAQNALAHYMRGLQSKRVRQDHAAETDFEEAVKLTVEKPSIVTARALYQLALLRANRNDWHSARGHMSSINGLLGSLDKHFTNSIECADMFVFRALSQLQADSTHVNAGTKSLQRAESIYHGAHTPHGSDLAKKLEKLIADLAEKGAATQDVITSLQNWPNA